MVTLPAMVAAPELRLLVVLMVVDPPIMDAPLMVALLRVLLLRVSLASSVTITPEIGYVAEELIPVPPFALGKIPSTEADFVRSIAPKDGCPPALGTLNTWSAFGVAVDTKLPAALPRITPLRLNVVDPVPPLATATVPVTLLAVPVTLPVTLPVTFPVKLAVIVPALKLPEASRATKAEAVLAFVAALAKVAPAATLLAVTPPTLATTLAL